MSIQTAGLRALRSRRIPTLSSSSSSRPLHTTAMPVLIYYGYPKASATDFDLEYYEYKHLGLVKDRWTHKGLLNFWGSTTSDPASPYYFQITTHWESLEKFKQALEEDGDAIVADIKNFTSSTPYVWHADVVAQME